MRTQAERDEQTLRITGWLLLLVAVGVAFVGGGALLRSGTTGQLVVLGVLAVLLAGVERHRRRRRATRS